MRVIERVRRFIAEHDLLTAESRVVAAVSGGSDSMALLHILRELDRAGELRLAGVAHFNHQLRPSAERDEQFVVRASSAFGLRSITDRDDVARRARRERRSLEHAGRMAREAFFERARVELGADSVAVGHTRDDQAETFLLRLLRGAGPRGLSGMHPRSGRIVRPLLDCRRAELRSWLAATSPLQTRDGAEASPARECLLPGEYVDDETNEDLSIPRNRVRAELLPLLAGRFNPAIVDALATEAALMRDLWTWAEEVSRPFLETPGTLEVAALEGTPPALRRLIVWRALSARSGGREISFDHVASVVRLIGAGPEVDNAAERRAVDVPGLHVQRIGGRIVINKRMAAPIATMPANLFSVPLSIPGEALVPGTGWLVSVEDPEPPGPPDAIAGNGSVGVVQRECVQGSLVVRNRRPGDRFRPVGLGGSKKLQDLFVDRKLPRAERDWVPLVVDETDRIVWVAGYGIDEAFRVTDPSQAVLVLRLRRA
jgi:tRNA(Ile)-lysidine synthase